MFPSGDRTGGRADGADGPAGAAGHVPDRASDTRELWRWATDWRLGFTGLSHGLLQLFHPGLGAGVAEHSDFFTDPWGRIFRSIGPIVASIRDDDTARAIRDRHRSVKGTDTAGRRYHALDPDTYWWAHITLYRSIELVPRRWTAGGMDEVQLEALYAEGVTWYRRYGVSDRVVPPTRADYSARFREICLNELEMTPAAERAVDMALHGRVGGLPGLPSVVAMPIAYGTTPLARLTAIGGLPEIVRRRFDIPWSLTDQLQYRALIVAVRESGRVVPPALQRRPMVRLARQSTLSSAA